VNTRASITAYPVTPENKLKVEEISVVSTMPFAENPYPPPPDAEIDDCDV
jgi:hypothetical protein